MGEGVSNLDPSMFPVPVLLDAGLRTIDQWEAATRGVRGSRARTIRTRAACATGMPVVGTETWTVPPERWPTPFQAILSLDLFDGQPRCAWGEPPEIDELLSHGVESLIVLDLARVGTGQGSGTDNLIRAIRKRWPKVELIAGGGVKNRDDLALLEEAGADAVLVASALHDGSLRFD